MCFANHKRKGNSKKKKRYVSDSVILAKAPPGVHPSHSACAGALWCLQRPRGPAFAPAPAAGSSRAPQAIGCCPECFIELPGAGQLRFGCGISIATERRRSDNGRKRHSAVSIFLLSRDPSTSAIASPNFGCQFWRPLTTDMAAAANWTRMAHALPHGSLSSGLELCGVGTL